MESAKNQPIYDVIIAGAGPVGLFLAGEAGPGPLRGAAAGKAEQPHSLLKQLPFGLRGLNAAFGGGAAPPGAAARVGGAQAPDHSHAPAPAPAGQGAKPQGGGHFAGIQLQAGKIDPSQWPYRLPDSTPTSLLAELEELETVLARRAEALGVVIRRGLGITGLQQDGRGVAVQADGHSFAGKWLVGCDGSRSMVRKLGGFDFVGTEPEFTGYTTQVDLADPEKLKPGRHVTPTGMYMQSQPGYLILQDFDGGAFRTTGQPVTREHLQQVLRRVSNTDVTITALHLATTWTDRSRQATTYRRGRVLLAGDAAHIHSPLGGQGLNLGLGDAMNLGWKLAATIYGHAPAGLLDSYTTERHPVGAQVLDWSRAQVAIMRPDPAARALHAIVRDLMQTRDGTTYFAGRIWGTFTHYPLAATTRWPATAYPTSSWKPARRLVSSCAMARAYCLTLRDNAALKTWAGAFSHQLRYVAGRAKDQLGLSALLIRPDGFVAWAADHAPDSGALHQAAAHWFVPAAATA